MSIWKTTYPRSTTERLLAVAIAAVALFFISATTDVSAREMCVNNCTPCQANLCGLECDIFQLVPISHCCGGGDGSTACNTGLEPDGFAVACEGGGGCICDASGNNCH